MAASEGGGVSLAVIGASTDAASKGLHSALRFSCVGNLRPVGFEHGRWVGSALMQRMPGEGDSPPPDER
jgi:L-amino acid N-acyltransferase YncA